MIHFAVYDSPFGSMEIGYEDESIVSIHHRRERQCHEPSALSDLAASQLQEYFMGKRRTFDFAISLKGTAFQKTVWQALLEIPYGEVRTYAQIAAAIGNPKAARAVGMACNQNPLWIVVPCHRVIGSNRKLTGYAGGLDMKRTLLELEHS